MEDHLTSFFFSFVFWLSRYKSIYKEDHKNLEINCSGLIIWAFTQFPLVMVSSTCILYLSHLSLAFFVCLLFGLGSEFCECLLLYLNLDHEWHDLYGHMHIPSACKIYQTYQQSSLNGSTSNLLHSTRRSFATSFSAQSGAASCRHPIFDRPQDLDVTIGTLGDYPCLCSS